MIKGLINPIRAKRWEHFTKDSKGVYYPQFEDVFSRFTMETLLDNTYVAACDRWGKKAKLGETSLTTDPGMAAFNKFAFPLVRRIYSQGIGRELVSVQPMQGPTSMIFFIDHTRQVDDTRLDNRGLTGTHGKARHYAHDPGEGVDGIRELEVGITSDSVTATSKKIKTKISVELISDMQNVHGIDAQGELLTVMSNEMVREIDEQIIYDLVAGAGAGVVNWNSNSGSTLPSEIEAHKHSIKDAIVDANNLVFSNIFMDATFIVGNVASIARLEKLEAYTMIKGPNQSAGVYGRKRVGTLDGQYAVYKDPWYPKANSLLVGYRGMSWLEVGYVYAPYVPYMVTEPFTNPDTLIVTRAAMSRQARKMINSGCYAEVNIVSS
jgi:hypothetical protein